jgi:hypothetical protein
MAYEIFKKNMISIIYYLKINKQTQYAKSYTLGIYTCGATVSCTVYSAVPLVYSCVPFRYVMPKCQYSFFSHTRFSLQVIYTYVSWVSLLTLGFSLSFVTQVIVWAVKETVSKASSLNQAHHLL